MCNEDMYVKTLPRHVQECMFVLIIASALSVRTASQPCRSPVLFFSFLFKDHLSEPRAHADRL